MSAAGEISVELRLKTGKLASDIRQGAQQIRSGLATSTAGWDRDPKEEQRRRINRQKWANIAAETKREELDAASRVKAPPKLDRWARMFETWQQSGLGPRGLAGRLIGGTLGGLVSAGMGGPVALALAGLTAAVIGARTALAGLRAEADRVAKTYARALFGSRTMSYQTTLKTVGGIFGTSEHETQVLMMSISGLAKRFEISTRTVERYTRAMIEFEVKTTSSATAYKTSMGKVHSLMLAPAIGNFADSMRVLLQTMQNSYIVEGLAKAVGFIAQLIAAVISFQNMLISAFYTIGNIIMDLVGWVVKKATFSLWNPSRLRPGEFLSEQTREMIASLKNPGPVEPPSAQGNARRYDVSAWERMGLVVGTPAGTDYQKQTAENTKRMASILSLMWSGYRPAIAGTFTPQNTP